jgi:tryptophanyl-tRNA synthetase
MVTPLGWLERVPTYKEALDNVKDKDLHTYGFLGYPCLQTADIVIYSADQTDLFVPVGEDQVSHVELSREIVRKFNYHMGLKIDENAIRDPRNFPFAQALFLVLFPAEIAFFKSLTNITYDLAQRMAREMRRLAAEGGRENAENVFEQAIGSSIPVSRFAELIDVLDEPEVMLTQTPRIPGLDGRKMSKSYGNAITLSESDADIRAKTKVMVTDPARKRRTDPGNPDVCPVYDWHKLFPPPPTLEWAANGCRTAGIGCIECKAAMADNLIKWIEPVRARRLEFEKDPAKVLQILNRGSERARDVAQKTMSRVREAVFGWDSKRKEVFGSGA